MSVGGVKGSPRLSLERKKVTVGELKELLDGINDNVEIFVGCEIGNRKFEIVGCEHPTGKKDKWDYIKLEYE